MHRHARRRKHDSHLAYGSENGAWMIVRKGGGEGFRRKRDLDNGDAERICDGIERCLRDALQRLEFSFSKIVHLMKPTLWLASGKRPEEVCGMSCVPILKHIHTPWSRPRETGCTLMPLSCSTEVTHEATSLLALVGYFPR